MIPSADGKGLYVGTLTNGVYVVNAAHPSAAPQQITFGGGNITGAFGMTLSPNGKTL